MMPGCTACPTTLALIQTVDFFTPIVDDPYWFGQIAAANALERCVCHGRGTQNRIEPGGLSGQIHGSGGPAANHPGWHRQAARSWGGADRRPQRGGQRDQVRPGRYRLCASRHRSGPKAGLRPGDRLVLSKPLGTGIVNTAIKAGSGRSRHGRKGRPPHGRPEPHSGRGDVRLPGPCLHRHHRLRVSSAIWRRWWPAPTSASASMPARVPILPEALEFAAMGLIPAGAYKNRAFSGRDGAASPPGGPGGRGRAL
jgi:selenide, water dikinase